ncbi:putative Zn finger-like uncharacterized protein [Pseudomonas nitritireducens]|uniref:Putative Zn finger-like uncharacterized protein n=1 Tax=Pseudomonas nitroreducens TaxID=46680 RepID=A0A7W7P678_PSENT|nr:DUF3426 domain-containing protein [Pseudomonas nitritireducens]MBB4868027.1 putative Zn finger-like uncharacterized protein [Pseudomonas nitritireducens]
MSDSFITQCPHCQTRFRVNAAQLGAASGAVRCGTCLKVFSAPQNMVGEATPALPSSAPIATPAAEQRDPAPSVVPVAPKPVATEPAPTPTFATFTPEKPTAPAAPATATLGWPLAPHAARHSSDVAEPVAASAPKVEAWLKPRNDSAPPVAATEVLAPAATVVSEPAKAEAPPVKDSLAARNDDTLWIHDDLDLDSLNLDEELAKLDEFELSQEFLSIDRAPKPSEALLSRQDEKRDPHDERWAEVLLEQEQSGASRVSRHEPSLGRLAAEAADEPAPTARLVADREPAQEPHEDEADDEPRIDPAPFSASKDDEDLPAFGARRDDDEPPYRDDLRSARDEHPRDVHEDDDEDVEPPLADQRGDRRRAEPGLQGGDLHDLNDEPLQLDWQKPQRRWGRRLFWLLLVLLALAGLAAQYIVYHFDELARQDQYRPWFAQACPELGCTLPSKVDVEQIRSSNLVVRSHPDFSGALVVDAIIYNRANFSQPFPLLEMRFADLNGQLIASRRFKPSEYLSGELAGQSEMPPQTPIHISLDILDPGPKAVNYSLSFHSPE